MRDRQNGWRICHLAAPIGPTNMAISACLLQIFNPLLTLGNSYCTIFNVM
ncbi:hypothetical protein NB703_000513 [Pantoea ananatis]|uniref:Uncharacterized protein n=1 Tax=Pantoea ananas TaxID=553 RepID=A0AAJ1FSG2_PANAN|nr:hypothetical protein [Pantoea ananatis]